MSIYNNHFNYDFDLLVSMLLPPILRKPKTIAFVTSLASGISMVHNDLIRLRKDSEYDAYFSQDRKTFEHYLNDEFDRLDRSIRIINADFLGRIQVYKSIEQRELRLYKTVENKPNPRLYKSQEFDTSLHFIIQIPNSINLTQIQLTALREWVDNRKLPNKNYIIQHI